MADLLITEFRFFLPILIGAAIAAAEALLLGRRVRRERLAFIMISSALIVSNIVFFFVQGTPGHRLGGSRGFEMWVFIFLPLSALFAMFAGQIVRERLRR